MSLPIHPVLALVAGLVLMLPGCGPTIDGEKQAEDSAVDGAEGSGTGGTGSGTGGTGSGTGGTGGTGGGGEDGTTEVDADGDGHPASVDCDDTDPAVHPGAIEVCFDATDNDCDGLRTCVDVVVWVEADGSDAGTGAWTLTDRLEGGRPTQAGDAVVEADLLCVAGVPSTFGCEPGSRHTFTLEWVDGEMVWGDEATVLESTWAGTLYRSDAEGAFDYAGGRFGYRQRVEFDAAEMDAGGGGPG